MHPGASNMAQNEFPREETLSLIASDKVEGTSVFNLQGEKLGSIHNFMVNKASGQVQYAVLTFGGLFGMGADYYPLPWESLTYDIVKNGYLVDIDKDTLKSGPHYRPTDEPAYDRAYGQSIHGHYGMDYPLV
jgi:hypothetical protein